MSFGLAVPDSFTSDGASAWAKQLHSLPTALSSRRNARKRGAEGSSSHACLAPDEHWKAPKSFFQCFRRFVVLCPAEAFVYKPSKRCYCLIFSRRSFARHFFREAGCHAAAFNAEHRGAPHRRLEPLGTSPPGLPPPDWHGRLPPADPHPARRPPGEAGRQAPDSGPRKQGDSLNLSKLDQSSAD